MLILSDRSDSGLALHEYLVRNGRCVIADINSFPARRGQYSLIVCDISVREESSFHSLGTALASLQVHANLPVLFLARDEGEQTVARAKSLGVTELVPCNASPALILAAATRLITMHKRRTSAILENVAETRAHALNAKATLAACFDAVRNHKPVALADVQQGADVVLAAIKKAKIRVWLHVVREFDDVTYQHCLLVTGLVAALSLKLGLTAKNRNLLSQAALIHDVGKARIPPEILNKPGALTKPEMEIMRTHAALGYDMIAGQADISPVILDVVRHHHEYLDGAGYPDGLRGSQISGYVRIVTICDIYAALIERRPYKTPMSPPRALAILSELGAKLDSELLKVFEGVVADSH